jgi:hypothetical protein
VTNLTVIEVARLFKFVRELTKKNDGAWVEAILRTVGAKKGDPWCCAYVCFCLVIYYGGPSKMPLPRTASCDVLRLALEKLGLETKDPKPGDIGFVMASPTDAVHVFFVVEPKPVSVDTIEGNTNDDGSREGYGVFELDRTRSSKLKYFRIPSKE